MNNENFNYEIDYSRTKGHQTKCHSTKCHPRGVKVDKMSQHKMSPCLYIIKFDHHNYIVVMHDFPCTEFD